MQHTERNEQVEAQLVKQRSVMATAAARITGLEAELEALRAGEQHGDILGAPRTEAIVAVLRHATGTLPPTEILERLQAAGRSDEMRSLTPTLHHLFKRGKVQRPTRGRYLAS